MTLRLGKWLNRVIGGSTACLVSAVSAQAADLTVGAFGGVWEQSLRKCMIEPFEKKTGKKVDVVLGNPIQWLNQIAASPGKPPFDIVYLPTENAFDAIQRGLVDKFTPDKVPNFTKVEPQFQAMGDGFGTVHNFGAMGLIYNSKTVPTPPKDWKEFFEGTVAGKWKASMPGINYPSAGLTISVWYMAKLNGGDIDHIEPGFEMIKKMRASGNLTFWSDPNQVLNALKSGETDIAMYWDGRAWAFIDDGQKDFKYYNPAPGAVVALTWIQKVKNSSELAYEYANLSLSPEAQSCFGSAIRYGVATAHPEFDPKVAHEITQLKETVIPPFKEVTPRQAKWVETWNKEIH